MFLIGDFSKGSKQARLTCSATIIMETLEGPVLPCIHAFTAQLKAGPSLSVNNQKCAANRVAQSRPSRHDHLVEK
jgi:hypothetical protein